MMEDQQDPQPEDEKRKESEEPQPERDGSPNEEASPASPDDATASGGARTCCSCVVIADAPSRSRRRLARQCPRLFHLVFRVLVPLFGLIGMSFLCGYFVALAESMGVAARRITELGDFAPALAAALAHDGPDLLDVVVHDGFEG